MQAMTPDHLNLPGYTLRVLNAAQQLPNILESVSNPTADLAFLSFHFEVSRG